MEKYCRVHMCAVMWTITCCKSRVFPAGRVFPLIKKALRYLFIIFAIFIVILYIFENGFANFEIQIKSIEGFRQVIQ